MGAQREGYGSGEQRGKPSERRYEARSGQGAGASLTERLECSETRGQVRSGWVGVEGGGQGEASGLAALPRLRSGQNKRELGLGSTMRDTTQCRLQVVGGAA